MRNITKKLVFGVLLSAFLSSPLKAQVSSEGGVLFTVDARAKIESMKPIWAWVGYDEPNYTYMKDGTKLLTELAELSPVAVNVRAHNLLTSGINAVILG